MNKTQVIKKIKETGIIAVIRTDSTVKAEIIIAALIKGGIDVLEVTMTIPGAVELIKRLTSEYKNTALIGAGTVLDEDAAQKCVEAGAKFIVSPILNRKAIAFCNQNKIAVMPGALTPAEIFNAWQAGADMIKIFPVSALGGVSYLKAVKAVFPRLNLVPTGGINLKDAFDFIEAGAVAVGMGSELTKGTESVITNQARNLQNKTKLNSHQK